MLWCCCCCLLTEHIELNYRTVPVRRQINFCSLSARRNHFYFVLRDIYGLNIEFTPHLFSVFVRKYPAREKVMLVSFVCFGAAPRTPRQHTTTSFYPKRFQSYTPTPRALDLMAVFNVQLTWQTFGKVKQLSGGENSNVKRDVFMLTALSIFNDSIEKMRDGTESKRARYWNIYFEMWYLCDVKGLGDELRTSVGKLTKSIRSASSSLALRFGIFCCKSFEANLCKLSWSVLFELCKLSFNLSRRVLLILQQPVGDLRCDVIAYGLRTFSFCRLRYET